MNRVGGVGGTKTLPHQNTKHDLKVKGRQRKMKTFSNEEEEKEKCFTTFKKVM